MIISNTSQAIQDNQDQIKDLLIAQDFTNAIEVCQAGLAKFKHPQAHWLHGLAVLLNGDEEDAQAIWMMAMLDADEQQAESWICDLVQTLDQSAEAQEQREYLEQAWLIRHHICEINPEHSENLLKLIRLELIQAKFSLDSLAELGIIDRLNSDHLKAEFQTQSHLLLEILDRYLDNAFPDEMTVAFVKAIRPYITVEDFIAIVGSAASIKIGHLRHLIDLAIPLLELCLEINPGNLFPLTQLAEMTLLGAHYERTADFAQQILDSSSTAVTQVIGGYYLLKAHLHMGHNRAIASATANQQEQNLRQLIAAQPTLTYAEARQLIVAIHLFCYWSDRPEIYRTLQNQVLQLCEVAFQTHWHENYRTYQEHRSLQRRAEPHPNKKIKVGYICSCFYNHSVGWLARWLVQHHDIEKFDIYIYAVNLPEREHPIRDFYAHITPNYRSCTGDSGFIADVIHQDEIDILIDLDSITRDTVCTVMALKPAPIQATWLGWDAIGMSSIDYYIADNYALPESAQDYYTEKIWRLPRSYISVDGFEIGVPTLRRSDLGIPEEAVVFLNPQRGFKLHPETTKLQLQILKQTPNSYFLVKGNSGQNGVQDFFKDLADEVGLDHDRLRFLPHAPSEEIHRANLLVADIVLDTFPFNGATTTLEALWMERPIVTLVGQQFAARNSYTMMMNAGITEGISWTPEEYVAWGIRLGTEPELRQQVAWKLRQSKQSAPLWNGKAFTQQMEAAYTEMYSKYLKTSKQ
jgi:predicted O-linked N-acetylglucosamine transferase (SPINDLY family)